MRERNGTYYVLFGHGCCFCSSGSGVSVFTATSPLGPYSHATYDIGCKLGEDVANCTSVHRGARTAVVRL